MSKKEFQILLLLATAQFINIVGFMIIMPLGPQLMGVFDITTGQFSMIVSVYSISAGVSAMVSSFFIDDFDRKRSFLAIYLGFIVGTFLCALSTSYNTFLLARIFTGFFGGIMGSQIVSIVGDIIQPSHRGRALGLVMSAFSVAAVLGVPLGLVIAVNSSWHWPFFGLAGFGMIVFFFGMRTLPPMRAHLRRTVRRRKTEIYPYLLKNPKLLWALSLFPTLMMAHFIVIPFISPYLSANLGFSDLELSYVYLAGGACTIFSSNLVGRWVDKTSPFHVFRILAYLALIPIFAITHLPMVPMWVALVVTSGFFVIASARTIPAITAVSNSIEPRFRGGFLSINTALQQMGAGLASFVGGLIVSTDLNGKIIFYNRTSYIVVIATFMCLIIFKKFKDLKSQPALDPLPPEVVA